MSNTNYNDSAYEILPVFGTREEIEQIIEPIKSVVSIVDWGEDKFGDKVVELKMPAIWVEEIIPILSQGYDDLGSPSMGIEKSFKPTGPERG